MQYHHSSIAKGYVRKGQPITMPYKGKYGNGMVKHIPNLECRIHGRVSTNYHIIEYYIEQ